MAITDEQLAKLTPKLNRPTYPPNPNDWSNLFNPAHEEILMSMFGKVDDPLDNFAASLVLLRSTLFAPVIGRTITTEEIPVVLSLAAQVSNAKLALRCLYTLEQIARDGLNPTHHRLVADVERVLEELKIRHPDVVEAREESRKAQRERKERDEAATS